MFKTVAIRIGILFAILGILGTASAANPGPPLRHPATSYWDRIQDAVQQGAISEEQALVLGVTALFAPERLPQPFSLGQRGKCGTPVLAEAEARWAALPAWARAAIAEWPVAAGARNLSRADTRPSLSGPEQTLPTAHFLIHYTIAGADAVDIADGDGNGIPDYVDTAAQAMEHSRQVQVDALGWLEPPSDENTDPGSPLYDLYIANLSVDGLTFPEALKGDNEHSPHVVEPFARTSYIMLHSRLSRTVLQVTAAHEYHHAIQFGYNAAADGFDTRRWLMEGTATWMEDQVYDDADDNVGYLPRLFAAPDRSLTDPQNYYASWLLFQYMEEHSGGQSAMREMWERAVPLQGDFSTNVIRATLQARGNDWGETFVSFCCANVLLIPCELTSGRLCYADALLYRDRAGHAVAEGLISIAEGEKAYVPPDGVQPLACDGIRILAQTGQVAASGYSPPEQADLRAAWLGHAGFVAETLPIPMRHDPVPPESDAHPSRYDHLYVLVANVSDPSAAPLEYAPYGLMLRGTNTTPTPSPTASPSPTATPSSTPTPTPGPAWGLWLPIIGVE